MSTTKTFQGMSDEAKPSSRVLRPPGGGSSHIFGDISNEPAKPAAKPYQKTSLFGSEPAAPPHQNRRGGPTGAAAAPFASDMATSPAPAPAKPSAPPAQSGNILAPEPAATPAPAKPARAPAENPLAAGSTPPAASNQVHTSTKVRQPPGGASSGPLW